MNSEPNIRDRGPGTRDRGIRTSNKPGTVTCFEHARYKPKIDDCPYYSHYSYSSYFCPIIVGFLLAVGLAGCSKDYEQKKLGKDSPDGQRVRAMLQELRQAGEKGLPGILTRQAAGGLTDAQTQSLQASLVELIRAESVELERLDSFGPQVYRATFTLVSAGKARSAAMLLVSKDGDLRWAGRN